MKKDDLRVTLAQVTRSKLGRFISIEDLRVCEAGNCQVDTDEDLERAVLSTDALLETIEELALETDPEAARAAAEIVREYRQFLRSDQAAIFDEQRRLRAAELRSEAPGEVFVDDELWLNSKEVSSADITGLTGREASKLSLRLANWNPGAKNVYSKRQGKRYLNRDVFTVQINDPVIIELGLDEEFYQIADAANLTLYREQPEPPRRRRRL